jgi:multidrug resistance efflux pump
VQTGQLLAKLDNPEWRARLMQLAAMPVAPRPLGDNDLSAKERQLLRARANRAEQRVQQLESLVRQGAATRGEVLAAQTERDGFQSELLAFERREQLAHLSPQGLDQEVIQQNTEQQWLKTRLQALSVTAPQSGRIAEVLVTPGENVGPGTLLMRLEQLTDPLLWIYLEPLYVNYAQPGQPLKVHMPDGEWLDAHVVQAADSASRTPLVLRGPFAASEMGLQVAARFDQPLPARWRIDQLPLNVRFPHDWLRMLGINK